MIVINPEVMMKPHGGFQDVLGDNSFASKLMGIIFDEGHCITKWGDFREEYRALGRLRWLLPNTVFYVTSATLSKSVLADVCRVLHLRQDNTVFFHRSNDRPNVFLGVHKMRYSASSFEDLDFLFAGWKLGDPPPPKFLILFDSKAEAEAACKHLWERLPKELKPEEKIKWFHADMTDAFRNDEVDNIMSGDTWGLCATDSFGMVRAD